MITRILKAGRNVKLIKEIFNATKVKETHIQ